MVAVCRVGALIWHHAERHRKMTKRFVIPFHFLLLFLAKKAIITKYRTLQTKSVLAFSPPLWVRGAFSPHPLCQKRISFFISRYPFFCECVLQGRLREMDVVRG